MVTPSWLDQPPERRAGPDAGDRRRVSEPKFAHMSGQLFDPGARSDRPRDYGMRIDLNGQWHHQGAPILRQELVRLFASVLRRDAAGGYWLVTPVEHGRILVEDVPFVAVELAIEGEGREQVIRLRSNIDEWATVGPAHPLVMRPPGAGSSGSTPPMPEPPVPVPYVTMRPGLEARLSRSVYYELVALGEQQDAADAAGEGGGELAGFGVWSAGTFFALNDDPCLL